MKQELLAVFVNVSQTLTKNTPMSVRIATACPSENFHRAFKVSSYTRSRSELGRPSLHCPDGPAFAGIVKQMSPRLRTATPR